ncbi:hypothetical protein F442_18652 [Phytophthora nicotianae P10297]|uniref:Uncharacterized protein n=3 Tax=Phytophthora nicotianae TaxID=4792 RepID=V9DZ36_PHYNI|nr:hypothetical protein F443_21163 [Phytophthora nicotianae P1569]ETM34903.1 hypothetical protein L914_18109 [Phytophthora nicotianae]ETP32703.1 hypothetical protein F442_18652 [Phytophthora nicotianae P10297]
MMNEEMELLAMDEEALIKMRVNDWNFDTFVKHQEFSTQPERTKEYSGLFTGEYEPTEEVLELAESPLRLFFLLLHPPRPWRRIVTESNRYYNQQLNGRVDRMVAAQQARVKELTR